MKFEIERAIEVLSRTPAVLHGLLDGLGEHWTRANYGDGTFSPFDVLGHLIHGERTDWIPRARIILEHGEARTFEPFDRFAQYDESRGKSVSELLDEFTSLRAANINALRTMRITPHQLALCGSHPEFGTVTLEAMLATWVAHDLNHIAQITRAMAHQYRDEVGPWRRYLSILR